MHWKDFLYFQRGSRLAVLLLLILIVLTLILNILLSYRHSSDRVLQQNDSLIRAFEQYRSSWKLREPAAPTGSDWETEGLKRKAGDVAAGTTTDRGDFRIRHAGDNDAFYPVAVKLTPGETISLNEADTARWKMIPGIGSSYAARIVKYRELLGGFVRKEQLLEVYGVDGELYGRISPYIAPDSVCHRLSVNRAEFRELLRHPYLSYSQVQAIVNLRRKKGDIRSIRELAMLEAFTEEDINRLQPYLEF
ncbi:MAG: helix-hairpin-helix domain-containing protein [Proteiniphilum sp.]|nr:helix-hairpin-helix domain-containing protein [Proteiniphilum sp.]MDD4799636.1 helix-hairpin-helix domain-containing protein [Proteiniphilum sp.]